jgi:hypothetical protein
MVGNRENGGDAMGRTAAGEAGESIETMATELRAYLARGGSSIEYGLQHGLGAEQLGAVLEASVEALRRETRAHA